MDTQIITVYCLCDELLKSLAHRQDPQCQMNDAETLTTALVAALFFSGNFEKARLFLQEQGYIPSMLSRSRFNRRLHRLKPFILLLFRVLAESWKELNHEQVYIVDTFPVAACDNIRIKRARLYQAESYRGYQASKRRYFYGLKIHLIVTQTGQPVEFFLTPGSFSDTAGLECFDLDLPAGAWLIGDKAYNDYEVEDILKEAEIELLPIRKKNSKRPLPAWISYLQGYYRKMVETAGSLIERLLPKSIHAVTPVGFELKVVLFVLASSLNHLKSV